MELRKVLRLNTILAITIPKHFAHELNMSSGDYAEIFLANSNTIIVKKHDAKNMKLTRAEVAQVAALTK